MYIMNHKCYHAISTSICIYIYNELTTALQVLLVFIYIMNNSIASAAGVYLYNEPTTALQVPLVVHDMDHC